MSICVAILQTLPLRFIKSKRQRLPRCLSFPIITSSLSVYAHTSHLLQTPRDTSTSTIAKTFSEFFYPSRNTTAGLQLRCLELAQQSVPSQPLLG